MFSPKLFVHDVYNLYTTTESMGEPAIGDVQLVPSTRPGYSKPLVYFTNGIQPPQWGAICYDSVVKADAQVFCNQVGFEMDDSFPFMGLKYVLIKSKKIFTVHV